METNTERNFRVQKLYDELMAEGKHGHYETMFRIVRLEVEAEREACAKVCEAMIDPVADSWRENRPDEAAHFDTCDIVCQNCADTIRLRSNVLADRREPIGEASNERSE